MSNGKVILYASYQTGENLPGYVQFALKHLAETDFTVVLLTNKRPLSAGTMSFLEDNGIKLFLTENHGFDFGMWRRFLKEVANGRNSFVEFNSITRLLLVNDSIVYFQNKFAEYSIYLKIIINAITSSIEYTNKLMEAERLTDKYTEIKEDNVNLSIQSKTDELTGILNRRGFYEFGQRTLDIIQEMEHAGIVFYADMDNLKKINDTYGHETMLLVVLVEMSLVLLLREW